MSAKLLLLATLVMAIVAESTATAATSAPASAFAQARRTAQARVAALRGQHRDLDATWTETVAGPALLTGFAPVVSVATAQATALAFAKSHANLWGIEPEGLAVQRVVRSKAATAVHLVYSCKVGQRRAPVLDRSMTVTLDSQRAIAAVTSDMLPIAPLAAPLVSLVPAQIAVARALGLCGHGDDAKCAAVPAVQRAALAVVADMATATAVWAFDVQLAAPLDRRAVLVSASTGLVVRQTRVAID